MRLVMQVRRRVGDRLPIVLWNCVEGKALLYREGEGSRPLNV